MNMEATVQGTMIAGMPGLIDQESPNRVSHLISNNNMTELNDGSPDPVIELADEDEDEHRN